MSLLRVSELSFEYSCESPILESVSFSIDPGDRLAIVGPNGIGKSTLLRLLAGRLRPTGGEIIVRSGLRISMVDQEFAALDHLSLFDFVFEALPVVSGLRREIRHLETQLSNLPQANEYADRINEYQEVAGFSKEAEVAQILIGIGFKQLDLERSAQTLSGGERTRAALARALSTPSDLLILDEPTNHLDVEARRWLEQHLASRLGACVLTSHDRALLKSFANEILEIDGGKLRHFTGNYEQYRAARNLLDRQNWAEYEAYVRRKAAVALAAGRREKLATRVAATPDGIRGGKDHYARKAAKVARTARILRERVTEEPAVQKPWEHQPIDHLSFEHVSRSGDIVLSAERLTKSYGPKTLFRDLSITVSRGERLMVLGMNGSGKSTLLNILRGTLTPDDGFVRLGANVQPAFIAQNLDEYDTDRSPLEICGRDLRARTVLACLKLRPECLNHRMAELSGGERTKVSLARVLNSGANLLILDEPTNHLEIEAQEALEQALQIYPGTIIVVSHDRCFLDALEPATQLNLCQYADSSAQ
jgi:ATP-binding cassette subfamily F protein 3